MLVASTTAWKAQAEEEAAKCKQQVGDMQIELATQKAWR